MAVFTAERARIRGRYDPASRRALKEIEMRSEGDRRHVLLAVKGMAETRAVRDR